MRMPCPWPVAARHVAVVDAGQVRDVLFGARGAAHGLVLGAAVPDHCTAELAAHGVDCIDAPVSLGPARVMARCA
jgi:3-hydroxyisobutyrate dehydrogenase-like beta-hydroxyacid dehydrogenase